MVKPPDYSNHRPSHPPARPERRSATPTRPDTGAPWRISLEVAAALRLLGMDAVERALEARMPDPRLLESGLPLLVPPLPATWMRTREPGRKERPSSKPPARQKR